MIITRPELMERLEESASLGSLLVVGEPGSGKTWLLTEFVKRRKSAGDTVVLIRAEDHAVRSLSELQVSLGVSDIAGALGTVHKTSYLVIDSLDALRAESSQRAFRDLIRLVTRQAPQCRIVASMRSFDARQSVEFHSLFPPQAEPVLGSLAIPVRNLPVPRLDDQDLEQACASDARLTPVVEHASAAAAELLRVPYNLWLVIRLLDLGVTVDWFSTVQSDVQLLESYWRHRIDSKTDAADRQSLLTELTNRMVGTNTLSVATRDVLPVAAPKQLQTLLSDEVLYQSATGRLSYAHNILFDFAVARLLIDEENLTEFISDQPARSIFYRPSIAYFLTRLWFVDRAVFWLVTQKLFSMGDTIPPRAMVVAGNVLINVVTSDEDLEPLFHLPSQVRVIATLFLLRAMQAFDSLASRKQKIWTNLLCRLATEPHIQFINEYIGLLDVASTANPNDEALLRASIRYLKWMWEEAKRVKAAQTQELSSLAAARVIPIVARLFAANSAEAGQALRFVLDRFGEPTAAANEAYWLANNVDHFLALDPELVVDLYRRVFAHEERSQERTRMGGSVVLAMTSTRAQDFSMTYYILGQKYKKVLEHDLFIAARAAAEAINGEVERREGDTVSKLGVYDTKIVLYGVESRLRSDRSEIWDQGYRDSEGLAILQQLLQTLSENIAASRIAEVRYHEIVATIASANRYAVTWKRFLEHCEHQPEFLAYSTDLLLIPELLAAPETTVAAGQAIRTGFTNVKVSAAWRSEVQNAILRVPTCAVVHVYKDANLIRNRLLGCIPSEFVTSEARKILDELHATDGVPPNEPFFKIGSVSQAHISDDYWLRQQGASPELPQNQRLLHAEGALKQFSSEYVNGAPPDDECVKIAPALSEAFNVLNGEVDAEVACKTQVLTTIAAAAGEILKNDTLPGEAQAITVSRRIVLEAAVYPYPISTPDVQDRFERPAWGPTPRIEAAQGVMHYIWARGLDADFEAALKTLSTDAEPAVRYQVSASLVGVYKHDRKLFWQIADSMLDKESTTGVLLGLATSVCHGFVARNDQDTVVGWIARVLERVSSLRRGDEVLDVVIDSATQISLYFDNKPADMLVRRLVANPVIEGSKLVRVVESAARYISQGIMTDDAADKNIRERSRKLILDVVRSADDGMQTLSDAPRPDSESEAEVRRQQVETLLRIPDAAVFRFYILLGVNEQLRRDDSPNLSVGDARKLFVELEPFWTFLTVDRPPNRRLFGPSTTHHLMETSRAMLNVDADLILRYAAGLLGGYSFGYQFDSMAVEEIVRLTDTVIADHKEILRIPENAANLGTILDVFVAAGWPQATQLVMRLDGLR